MQWGGELQSRAGWGPVVSCGAWPPLVLLLTRTLWCREWFAVWVGNLTPRITQEVLLHLFQP